MNSVPRLCVKNLSLWLNQSCLLNNLSFTLRDGHLLQIVGANGSGKSTLLKLLAGLQNEEGDSIRWHNDDYDEGQCANQLAYLGHQNGLKNDLSVVENFELSLSVLGSAPGSAISILSSSTLKDTFLAQYDLVDYQNKLVKNLSFGQKRKTALGRLFILQKQIWLLDEPFVGLDDKSVQYTKDSLLRHCLKGGGVIMTSHSAQSFDHQLNTHSIEL